MKEEGFYVADHRLQAAGAAGWDGCERFASRENTTANGHSALVGCRDDSAEGCAPNLAQHGFRTCEHLAIW